MERDHSELSTSFGGSCFVYYGGFIVLTAGSTTTSLYAASRI